MFSELSSMLSFLFLTGAFIGGLNPASLCQQLTQTIPIIKSRIFVSVDAGEAYISYESWRYDMHRASIHDFFA